MDAIHIAAMVAGFGVATALVLWLAGVITNGLQVRFEARIGRNLSQGQLAALVVFIGLFPLLAALTLVLLIAYQRLR